MFVQRLVAILFLCFGALQGAAQSPNIVLILVDDLGYHDVSYYGTADLRTPNIDTLCKDGIRFDRFYANSSVCAPTRASLLTGRYPELVGVPGLIRSSAAANFGFLAQHVQLLPSILAAKGYHTALIGKWNLGFESPNTPTERGFHYFYGFLDDMMDDYYTHLRYGKNFMRENEKVIDPEGHATDIFTKRAVDYIHAHSASENPLFLYLAYNAPHYPVQPPDEWLAKVRRQYPALDERRAKLVALIEHLDDGIGKVVMALKETGQFENTLLIFLSDNGGRLEDGANNGLLRDGKQSMYEGGLRVPALFVWPGHIPSGSQTEQAAISMDIFPTICEIVGIPVSSNVDGVSLLPLLESRTQTLPERPLFFSRREGGVRYGGKTIEAVIYDDWKLLQNTPFEFYQLYNLYEDPQESRDLVSVEMKRFEMLQKMLISHIKRGGSIPWQQ